MTFDPSGGAFGAALSIADANVDVTNVNASFDTKGGIFSIASPTVNLGTITVDTNNGGNGQVTIGGPIGAAASTVTFDVGTTSLALTNAANNFGTVAVTSAQDVTLVDSNGLILGASTIAGNLSATAGGTIDDSGTLAVTGTASFVTELNGGAAITLDQASSTFGAITARSLNTAGTVNAAGTISITENAAMDLALVDTTGNANFTSTGAITDSGVLTIGGTTTLAAGANDILLNTAGNDFGTVVVTTGKNVTLVDTNSITLGNVASTGDLDVSSVGFIQSNGTTVDVTAGTIKVDAGNGTFAMGTGTFTTTNATASAVTIQDTTTAVLGNINAVNGQVNLGLGTTVADPENLSGAVTQTAATLINASKLQINAGSTITLTQANTIGELVNVNRGGAFSLTDATGGLSVTGPITGGTTTNLVTLSTAGGALAINGSITTSGVAGLSLTGAGITQTGGTILTGSGTTTLVAGAGNDIVLNAGTNNFATVAITSGKDVTLQDADGIILGASTVTGNFVLTAGGNVTQRLSEK